MDTQRNDNTKNQHNTNKKNRKRTADMTADAECMCVVLHRPIPVLELQ